VEVIRNKTSNIWYKAAALGSIWASIEIVLGSFLHNLRFPMSGSILASFAVILLISFSHLWQERGLILRAGIIAALMKSVSPSAILIGPMVGIFLEALIIEITLFLFGRNFFSFFFSGIFAIYSVLIHKIVTLLILYGFDIVRISENLFIFVTKQLNVKNLEFLEALFYVSLIYAVIGIIASFIGIRIGKNIKNLEFNKNEDFKIKSFDNKFFQISENQKFSVWLFVLHILIITSIFILLNYNLIYFAIIISVIYLLFNAVKYINSFRYFRKIGFWLQIFVVLLISIFFYNGIKTHTLFDKEGFYAGLSMIIRMLVLIVGFASISVELRNPFIKTVLFRSGLGNVYHSLGLAFSVLPYIMEQSSNPQVLFKNPKNFITSMVIRADAIYNKFLSNIQQRQVIIITGKVGSGKTPFLKNLITKLKQFDKKIIGFTAEAIIKNNEKIGFDIEDINSDKKTQLASVEKIGSVKIGQYFFSEKGFEFGQEILNVEKITDKSFVVIDEVGFLELKNLGWSKSIDLIFDSQKVIQIWTVRSNLVKDVIKRFGISKAEIFDISIDTVDDCASYIYKNYFS